MDPVNPADRNPSEVVLYTVVFQPNVLFGPSPEAGTRCVSGYQCNLTMVVSGLPPYLITNMLIQVLASDADAGSRRRVDAVCLHSMAIATPLLPFLLILSCSSVPGNPFLLVIPCSRGRTDTRRRLVTAETSDFVAISTTATMSEQGVGTFVFPWLVPASFLPTAYSTCASAAGCCRTFPGCFLTLYCSVLL